MAALKSIPLVSDGNWGLLLRLYVYYIFHLTFPLTCFPSCHSVSLTCLEEENCSEVDLVGWQSDLHLVLCGVHIQRFSLIKLVKVCVFMPVSFYCVEEVLLY